MNVTAIKGEFVDHAKAVIHCGQAAWNGWDAELGETVEIIPYIRPYGLEEGFVFRGRAVQDGAQHLHSTRIESFPPTEEERVSEIPVTGTDAPSAPAPESPAAGLFTTIGIIGLIAVLLMRKRSGGRK